MFSFSTKQIEQLEHIEHRMDSGILSYVILDGCRLAVSDAAMKELNLKNGQSVDFEVQNEIIAFEQAEKRNNSTSERTNTVI